VKHATRPAIFKWRQTAPALILCAVRWYLRYSLSLRDVEELLAEVLILIAHRRGGSQPARLPGAALCTARFLCPFPDNLAETLANFVAALGGSWVFEAGAGLLDYRAGRQWLRHAHCQNPLWLGHCKAWKAPYVYHRAV